MLHPEPRARLMKDGLEGCAAVGEHDGDAEGERAERLLQERDRPVLCEVFLHGEVYGAGAAIDGDEQVTPAHVAVRRAQDRQMLRIHSTCTKPRP